MIIENRYRKADIPRLFAINEICFAGEQCPPEQIFTDMLMTSDVWIARVSFNPSVSICGFIIVKPDSIPYLWSLAVLPAHRDQKIGTDLLAAAEKHYASKDYAEISLHVHSENWKAQRFYLARGYRMFGIDYEWYTDGLGLRMVKRLNG